MTPSWEFYDLQADPKEDHNAYGDAQYQGIIKQMKKEMMQLRRLTGDTRDHYVMPLCVKLFRQRWYMVGRNWPAGKDIVFCLDRIQDFRLSSHTFEYPEDFDPQEYFKGCIGVIPGEECGIERVKIKVCAGQANYLRDLPLHKSQQESERTDSYSIFELQVRPTFDFQQELLWDGEDLEVLEPRWLRKEIAGKVKRIWNKYK